MLVRDDTVLTLGTYVAWATNDLNILTKTRRPDPVTQLQGARSQNTWAQVWHLSYFIMDSALSGFPWPIRDIKLTPPYRAARGLKESLIMNARSVGPRM